MQLARLRVLKLYRFRCYSIGFQEDAISPLEGIETPLADLRQQLWI